MSRNRRKKAKAQAQIDRESVYNADVMQGLRADILSRDHQEAIDAAAHVRALLVTSAKVEEYAREQKQTVSIGRDDVTTRQEPSRPIRE